MTTSDPQTVELLATPPETTTKEKEEDANTINRRSTRQKKQFNAGTGMLSWSHVRHMKAGTLKEKKEKLRKVELITTTTAPSVGKSIASSSTEEIDPSAINQNSKIAHQVPSRSMSTPPITRKSNQNDGKMIQRKSYMINR